MLRTAITLLLVTTAFPALARDISGEAGYLPRIALDPGAQLVVELSGPGGLVATTRVDSDGRQVPLPFAISTAAEDALTLRAAIMTGGVIQWVSPQIAVPAGTDAVDLGQVTLRQYESLGFTSRYRCGDAVVVAGFSVDKAWMRIGDKVYVLPIAISASGARYSDDKPAETMIWTARGGAQVSIDGDELRSCEAQLMPSALPFVAHGNEPGWILNIGDDEVSLEMQDGTRTSTARPAIEAGLDGANLSADGMAVTVRVDTCRDSMTGLPYPYGVSVRTDDAELKGCGGDPLALLQGGWRVTQIGDDALPAGVEVTMMVEGDRLSGRAGCNRYGAALVAGGETLTIQPGPMTLMACGEDEMAIEHSFTAALRQVDGITFDDATGAPVFTAGERPLIATRLAP